MNIEEKKAVEKLKDLKYDYLDSLTDTELYTLKELDGFREVANNLNEILDIIEKQDKKIESLENKLKGE